MSSSDTVLQRTRVREVTGIFHSREDLDGAANDLLLGGFDRSDIDILGSLDEVPTRLGPVYVAPEELADIKEAPRRSLIARDDISAVNTVVASIVGVVCGLAAGYLVLASGGDDVEAGLTAVLIGLLGAAFAFLLMAWFFPSDDAKGLSSLMEHRGLILWVRVRSAEQEAKAQEILLRRGGNAVRVHEIELEKRPDDLPLGTVQPDPWLGSSELLGRPQG